ERSGRPPRVHTDGVAGLDVTSGKGAVRDTTSRLPHGATRDTGNVRVRVHRLDVEALERREVERGDDRPVLTARRVERRRVEVGPGELFLDLHVGKVQRGRGTERRDPVHTAEVTGGV